MSSNKIRKVDTSATPRQSRTDYGPATAALEYNDTKEAVEVNPHGTWKQLVEVVVSASSAPTGSDLYATGTFWVRQSTDKVYCNTGTLATPDWQILN